MLDCVREAERRVAGRAFMEYLPIGGDRAFVNESVKLAYGDALSEAEYANVAAVQVTRRCVVECVVCAVLLGSVWMCMYMYAHIQCVRMCVQTPTAQLT